jgi:hypothetical protein
LQIESQKRELEKVDQMMGKKRTELHLLQDSAERKQSEIAAVLREADAEATAKQRELRVGSVSHKNQLMSANLTASNTNMACGLKFQHIFLLLFHSGCVGANLNLCVF